MISVDWVPFAAAVVVAAVAGIAAWYASWRRTR